MPFCTIFRRSFIPPAKAANGSSNSLFIWPAIAWCDFPIASTSPRMTSREARRVPVSDEPNGLRHNPNSFRAYSSSIAARPRIISAGHIHVESGPKRSYYCRMLSIRRRCSSHSACAPRVAEPQHLPFPRSCSRLLMLAYAILCGSFCLQDSDTDGPSATVPGIAGTARPSR